jgi:5-methyltetrahydropteroyltriglutamate--homocysteine methyltransferase
MTVISSNLGYPRIGEHREWKSALESYWKGKIDEAELLETTRQLRLENLKKQVSAGIDLIPVGDFTLYDHVLDTSVMFGIIPKRFGTFAESVPLDTYFAMARGKQDAHACEMTKWFNTNYHYIVPEFDDVVPHLTENRLLAAYKEAVDAFGVSAKPVVVGPVSLVRLGKEYGTKTAEERLFQLLPLYERVFKELEAAGVEWVQVDEPTLVLEDGSIDRDVIQETYETLHKAAPRLKLILQTYFASVTDYEAATQLPVQGIGLDFVHGYETQIANLAQFGFPKDKVLAAGVIDGRNVWRADLQNKLDLIAQIREYASDVSLHIQPSSSLLHTPVHLGRETQLDEIVRNGLAFADEKLREVAVLAKAVRGERSLVEAEIENSSQAVKALLASADRNNLDVRQQVLSLKDQSPSRKASIQERQQIHKKTWKLPTLPTTTIGSFPQTGEVRAARRRFRSGEWTHEQYQAFIEDEISKWIQIQEELGLDVLVHGEFERTDMVEFFGEKLRGFAITKNGWVQSYGSRCVKPPLLFGDVAFVEPMTVAETIFAQSLTKKPVKGILTGPVTILNWSFVRDDIPHADVAYQLALALRKEVEALETAGIGMIQVDEPALREGLPLKHADRPAYLHYAVDAFRYTTCMVKNETQVHTHMCYCEFSDIIDDIERLDADVISLETSRSHGELFQTFETHRYNGGIGLGVYDIHSPRTPSVNEIEQGIANALSRLSADICWVNPDCGLKTRTKEETVPALKHLVEATKQVRERLPEYQKGSYPR